MTTTKNLTMRAQPGAGGEVQFVHGDDGQPMLTFKTDNRGRKFIVRIDDFERFSIVNVPTAQRQTAEVRQTPETGDAPEGYVRAWRFEGDEMVVWNDFSEVRLKREPKPGIETPQHEFEIFGQNALLFDIAMSLACKRNILLIGPTGVGKTSILRWLAYKLNWNFVLMPISRGTQDPNMIGEYMPVGQAHFDWVDGPVTYAARLSQEHKTILCLDEMNRIGNVAEYARIYSLLDDSRKLVLAEKRNGGQSAEVVAAPDLMISGTANPVDEEDGAVGAGDYIGVQELDPALGSRFHFQPPVPYPPQDIEAKALAHRVPSLDVSLAHAMVDIAHRIREAQNVRFPISFRDLLAWAEAVPYQGWRRAAEISVVRKAHPSYRIDINNLLDLHGPKDAAEQFESQGMVAS